MKVVDAVKKSFFSYPSLYARNSFEDVQFDVLHHYFIVLGNGIDWAFTKNPRQAGYLTEPKSRRLKGDWTRKYDLPYGKFKVDLDMEPYLKNEIYQLKEIDHERTKESLKTWAPFLNEDNIGKKAYHITSKYRYETEGKEEGQTVFTKHEFDKLPSHTLMSGDKYNESYKYYLALVEKKKSDDKRSPYPNFQKDYSCFWKPGSEFIQDDWKEAGYEHLKYWEEYFNDEKRIKTYSSYPNPKKLQEHIEKYCLGSKGQTIEQVAKDYEFPEFDGKNYKELSDKRWKETLQETKEFIEESLDKLKK